MSRHLKDCGCSMNMDSPNKHCENSKRPQCGRIPSRNNITCRQRGSVLKVLADFIRLLWVVRPCNTVCVIYWNCSRAPYQEIKSQFMPRWWYRQQVAMPLVNYIMKSSQIVCSYTHHLAMNKNRPKMGLHNSNHILGTLSSATCWLQVYSRACYEQYSYSFQVYVHLTNSRRRVFLRSKWSYW